MIEISESAQAHVNRLIAREGIPGLGVRLAARQPGTPSADVRLEFAGPDDLSGDEWAIDCAGFTLWVGAASVRWRAGAFSDYEQKPAGGQLQVRAPKIKREEPEGAASRAEPARRVSQHRTNPQRG